MSDRSLREVARTVDMADSSIPSAKWSNHAAPKAMAECIAGASDGPTVTAPPATEPLGGYVWYVIALLTAVNVFNYMDRMAMSVLLPSIKQDLELSDGQLGLLVGFAFAVFYAICGIPIARWADRGVRRNIIALALATWSVMTALCGAAHSFGALMLARIGVGVGEAGGSSPAQSILCDYVPFKRRYSVFALHNFGLIAGMMFGMALAGWLGAKLGWRWTFVALGLPGVVVALIVRLTLREPIRGNLDGGQERNHGASLRQTAAYLWSCRTYRCIILFYTCNGFIYFGLTQWWPTFFSRIFHMSLSEVGLYIGVALGMGSGLGLLVGGTLANKAVQRSMRLPLAISAAAMCLAIPTALSSLFVSSPYVSIALIFLTGVFWSVPNGPVGATLFSVVKADMRATAGSTTVLFSSVLGIGFGPSFVGFLSDLLTPSLAVEALRYALLVPVCLVPIAAFALYKAAAASAIDLPRMHGL